MAVQLFPKVDFCHVFVDVVETDDGVVVATARIFTKVAKHQTPLANAQP